MIRAVRVPTSLRRTACSAVERPETLTRRSRTLLVMESLLQVTNWAPGLVDEQTLYRYTSVALALAAVGFGVWTVRLSPRHRRYGLFAVYTTAALALAYVGMSTGVLRFENAAGDVIPSTRYVGYVLTIALMLLLLGSIGGMSTRLRASLLVPFTAISLGNFAGWLFSGTAGSLAGLASLASLPLGAYLLLGPGKRAARTTSGGRQLLYGKLTNLILLVWLGYLVVGVVSRQNAGLLDAFVGIFLGAYLDVTVVVGFGIVLLRHTGALDDLNASDESGSDAGDADAPTPAD